AAAEMVEEAVVELSSPKPQPRKPTTQPMATVAAPKQENTVPYAENPFFAPTSWDDRTPRSVVKTVVRQSERSIQRTAPRASSPATIIPVPKMPRAAEHQSRLEPVLRTPQVAMPPRRTAKGTGQQLTEETVRTSAVPPAPEMERTSERWRAANDEATKPSIALPPQQRLPSITKRVAAPQK
ncbi:MAG: hypothetical protein JWO36_6130, partial [Myxococcales bacterium]|nr:hypothetical protein [Myxococcales bacterium]